MPVISRFFGMVVKMYFIDSEHNPPHVHIIHEDTVGMIAIKDGKMLNGDLSFRALKLAQEWVSMNREVLLEMWETQNIHSLPPIK